MDKKTLISNKSLSDKKHSDIKPQSTKTKPQSGTTGQSPRRIRSIRSNRSLSISEYNKNKKDNHNKSKLLDHLGSALRTLVDVEPSTPTTISDVVGKPTKTDSTDSDDEEEAKKRKIKSAKITTIPIFSNKRKPASSDEVIIPNRSSSELRSFESNAKPIVKGQWQDSTLTDVIEEEDSDGYCNEIYIESLIDQLTSPDAQDFCSKEFSIQLSEDQRPWLSENFDRPLNDQRAHRVFDPRFLGYDEIEFAKNKFRAIQQNYLPDDIEITNRSRRHDNWGRRRNTNWPQQPNCGICFWLKWMIFIILFISLTSNLIDRCYIPSIFTSKFKDVNKTNLKQNVSKENKTIHEVSYCQFKTTYIIVISIGIILNILIYLLYTFSVIVYFHHCQWLLIEGLISLIYYITLWLMSTVAYLMINKPLALTLGKF